jgi:hypothetical protein
MYIPAFAFLFSVSFVSLPAPGLRQAGLWQKLLFKSLKNYFRDQKLPSEFNLCLQTLTHTIAKLLFIQ